MVISVAAGFTPLIRTSAEPPVTGHYLEVLPRHQTAVKTSVYIPEEIRRVIVHLVGAKPETDGPGGCHIRSPVGIQTLVCHSCTNEGSTAFSGASLR